MSYELSVKFAPAETLARWNNDAWASDWTMHNRLEVALLAANGLRLRRELLRR